MGTGERNQSGRAGLRLRRPRPRYLSHRPRPRLSNAPARGGGAAGEKARAGQEGAHWPPAAGLTQWRSAGRPRPLPLPLPPSERGARRALGAGGRYGATPLAAHRVRQRRAPPLLPPRGGGRALRFASTPVNRSLSPAPDGESRAAPRFRAPIGRGGAEGAWRGGGRAGGAPGVPFVWAPVAGRAPEEQPPPFCACPSPSPSLIPPTPSALRERRQQPGRAVPVR